ncbi:uncharacterized protein PHALS_04955 [Plasmopara halstedii]|uniref:Uncharacterized protein n=1 Tax=Plasmopara halstedii TaxID=4781 RepID=A0A0P1A9G4_PLAHL|nr:uncharacterized protein PHALS_04955 [Plasmopara halstedii]CEG37358.1 hypothetical protein PHALS_04955 [Plasmopara halstedii]|eukprot:XP_024573727.1 hypothetical protein PHALS_04955 [Plasmopara halstedii]
MKIIRPQPKTRDFAVFPIVKNDIVGESILENSLQMGGWKTTSYTHLAANDMSIKKQ